jgi:hypothetical protein
MKISITVFVFCIATISFFAVCFFFALFPGKNSKMYEKEMENGVP